MGQGLRMPDSTDVIDRASVFKQRRLLLTFSFALAAIHALDVQLSGNVTAQGLVLTFQHPQVLVIVLWIAWPWSLWRYWQYERHYADGVLFTAREAVAMRICEGEITKRIQEGVKQGHYTGQLVRESDAVTVKIPIGEQFTEYRYAESEWVFPNLNLYVQKPDHGLSGPVQGGANCSFSEEEVGRMKRSIELELIRRNPSFADFKAPYWIAMVAPLALLYQHLWPVVSCHWSWLGSKWMQQNCSL